MFGNDMTNDDITRLHKGNVVDQTGDKVGSVGQIYLDDQTNRPTWATVKTGLLGSKETFVPLADATMTNDEIRVPYTKDFVKDAPSMDADHHISEQEEDELYRYYNLSSSGHATTGVDHDAGADADRAHHADGGADHDRRADTDVDRDSDGSVVRREEELNVGKERVETGRVRLRKHVVAEQETVNVPVEREEVHVTREPVRDGEVGGRIGEDEDVSVTLHAERPVVDKETVAKERVGLDKDVVREDEQVTETVSKEQVEVERDGDVKRDGDADRDRR